MRAVVPGHLFWGEGKANILPSEQHSVIYHIHPPWPLFKAHTPPCVPRKRSKRVPAGPKCRLHCPTGLDSAFRARASIVRRFMTYFQSCCWLL